MSAALVTCVMLTTHPRRAGFMADALRSYRAQSYEHRELVVVNDGEPLRPTVPDIRVVNLPPRAVRWTLGEKRNAGVRLARGAYLATWDDDDVSLPDRLRDQVDAAQTSNAAAVLGDRAHVADERLRVLGICARVARAVQATALLRRDAVIGVGGYALADYREDVELLERIRLLMRGTVLVIDASWYVIRRHESHVTQAWGETTDSWIACALRDPARTEAQRMVNALMDGPGGRDVVPVQEAAQCV